MRSERSGVPWGWTTRKQRLLIGLVLLGCLRIVLGSSFGTTRRPTVPRLVVNPNDAPQPVLETLPRLGPVLSGRIVAGRRIRRFESLADIDARVRGIGPVTAQAIRPFLTFDPEPADVHDPVPKTLAPEDGPAASH